MKRTELKQLIKEAYLEVLKEETTPQFKKLIKRAKAERIKTADELRDLIANEFDDERNPITGADYEIAKEILRIKESRKRIKEDIPAGATRIHMYDFKNILRPRGSMKKESLSIELYDRFIDIFEDWTDTKYGDSKPADAVLNTIHKNAQEELKIAYESFLKRINYTN